MVKQVKGVKLEHSRPLVGCLFAMKMAHLSLLKILSFGFTPQEHGQFKELHQNEHLEWTNLVKKIVFGMIEPDDTLYDASTCLVCTIVHKTLLRARKLSCAYYCVEDSSVAPDFVGLLGKHDGGGHALLQQPVPHLRARVRQRRRRVEGARAAA